MKFQRFVGYPSPPFVAFHLQRGQVEQAGRGFFPLFSVTSVMRNGRLRMDSAEARAFCFFCEASGRVALNVAPFV